MSTNSLNKRLTVVFGPVYDCVEFELLLEARYVKQHLSNLLHGGMRAELHGIVHEAAEKLHNITHEIDVRGINHERKDCWFVLVDTVKDQQYWQVTDAPNGFIDPQLDDAARMRLRMAISRTVKYPNTVIAARTFAEWEEHYSQQRAARIAARHGNLI